MAAEVKWCLSVLPESQRKLWDKKIRKGFEGWVLYGGTGLALRLGHRTSVDFDFFSAQALAPLDFQRSNGLTGEILQAEPNTLTVVHEGVKLSFFGGLSLGVVEKAEKLEECWVAALADLAATKLAALVNRVEAKDYLDIATLLRKGESLSEMVGYAVAVYGKDFPVAACLKSLVYFEPKELSSLGKQERAEIEKAVTQVQKIPIKMRVADKIGG